MSRAVALLRCFTTEDTELPLGELAERSELPRTTAYRIAEELVAVGAMTKAPTGRYAVSLLLWKIASSSPAHKQLREKALPFLSDLYEATHETTQLSVLDGMSARILDKVTGPAAARNVTVTGGELPLHATGVGKVLLAFSPPDVLAELLSLGLKRHTARTIIQPGTLTANIAKVRHTLVGWSFEEMTPGVSSVAAPIRSPAGTLFGAIGVVAKSSRSLERSASAVRMAGLSIGRRLALH